MKRDKQQVLAEVAEIDRIVADVIAGKFSACKVCNSPLTYAGPGSGRHPGIYCASVCTEILMTIASKE